MTVFVICCGKLFFAGYCITFGQQTAALSSLQAQMYKGEFWQNNQIFNLLYSMKVVSHLHKFGLLQILDVTGSTVRVGLTTRFILLSSYHLFKNFSLHGLVRMKNKT